MALCESVFTLTVPPGNRLVRHHCRAQHHPGELPVPHRGDHGPLSQPHLQRAQQGLLGNRQVRIFTVFSIDRVFTVLPDQGIPHPRGAVQQPRGPEGVRGRAVVEGGRGDRVPRPLQRREPRGGEI